MTTYSELPLPDPDDTSVYSRLGEFLFNYELTRELPGLPLPTVDYISPAELRRNEFLSRQGYRRWFDHPDEY